MQMLIQKIPNQLDVQRLICMTFIHLDRKGKALHPKTIQRRLSKPIDEIKPIQLEIFEGATKIKMKNLLAHGNILFFNSEKNRWEIGQEGGAEA
jgi:hypothetical protein